MLHPHLLIVRAVQSVSTCRSVPVGGCGSEPVNYQCSAAVTVNVAQRWMPHGIAVTSEPHQAHPLTQILKVQENKIQANPFQETALSAVPQLQRSVQFQCVCAVKTINCESHFSMNGFAAL